VQGGVEKVGCTLDALSLLTVKQRGIDGLVMLTELCVCKVVVRTVGCVLGRYRAGRDDVCHRLGEELLLFLIDSQHDDKFLIVVSTLTAPRWCTCREIFVLTSSGTLSK